MGALGAVAESGARTEAELGAYAFDGMLRGLQEALGPADAGGGSWTMNCACPPCRSTVLMVIRPGTATGA
ncbi:hypothetical protein ABZY57_12870 [Streptomyces sp. NPDC006450]|uniref:hypothetical protein n=1 Tax=Streptomyces sp. NPDC006450 TaxID=3155458 RepID=UPI0033BB2182